MKQNQRMRQILWTKPRQERKTCPRMSSQKTSSQKTSSQKTSSQKTSSQKTSSQKTSSQKTSYPRMKVMKSICQRKKTQRLNCPR
jgi:hypothetical protein